MKAWRKEWEVSPIQDQGHAAMGTTFEDGLVAVQRGDRAEHADGGCAGAGLRGGRERM